MHELSIAQALVNQVAVAVRTEKASRASKIIVRVGTFSGVDPSALRAAFDVAREDEESTAQARLQIRKVNATAKCSTCGRRSRPEFPALVCPKCGSDRLVLQGGRDLIVESVEINT